MGIGLHCRWLLGTQFILLNVFAALSFSSTLIHLFLFLSVDKHFFLFDEKLFHFLSHFFRTLRNFQQRKSIQRFFFQEPKIKNLKKKYFFQNFCPYNNLFFLTPDCFYRRFIDMISFKRCPCFLVRFKIVHFVQPLCPALLKVQHCIIFRVSF